jgi:hypothetical protein
MIEKVDGLTLPPFWSLIYCRPSECCASPSPRGEVPIAAVCCNPRQHSQGRGVVGTKHPEGE